MLRKKEKEQDTKKRTLELKYQTLLEERIKHQDEIIRLHKKIEKLQDDNDIYQKVIIEDLEKDIQKEKARFKKLKELGL